MAGLEAEAEMVAEIEYVLRDKHGNIKQTGVVIPRDGETQESAATRVAAELGYSDELKEVE